VDAFRKLADMKFTGPIMLEMWNDDSPDALDIIRTAREWIFARMTEAQLVN
jgi:L-ribulose-5-phosphate 3-epimerase UlaE